MSCSEIKRSDPMVEDGVVVQTIHRPNHYHTSVRPVTHTDSKGHVSITIKTDTDYYDEAFYVVFACQHGQFVIDNKEIWKTVTPGMRVKIRYRQLDTYEKQDGKQVHIGTDYEFESAWPADGEWNLNDVVKTLNRKGLK